tara:strand:+ start:266 stop:511 length:246 start_codon:yes stop_codon:yes gene_type:complete
MKTTKSKIKKIIKEEVRAFSQTVKKVPTRALGPDKTNTPTVSNATEILRDLMKAIREEDWDTATELYRAYAEANPDFITNE